MTSSTHLTELVHRLRTAAQALKHPTSEHTLSSEERAALCEEVKAIAAELRRDWHIEAFKDWRARKGSAIRAAEKHMPSCLA
jgi:hypothetical protein